MRRRAEVALHGTNSGAPSPLVVLAASFAAGIAFLGHTPAFPTAGGMLLFPALLVLSAAGGLLASRRGHRRLALLALACAFFVAGALRAPAAQAGPSIGPCSERLARAGLPTPTPRERALLEVEGIVDDAPRFSAGRGRATFLVDRARLPSLPRLPPPPFVDVALKVELSLPDANRPLPGDRVRLLAQLDDPPPDLHGGGRALQRQRLGIVCAGRVAEGRIVLLDDAPWGSLEAFRRRLVARLASRLDDDPASALVIALGLGDRERITQEQSERFADSGLAHLVSVSGLHLALTVLGLFKLLAYCAERLGHAGMRRALAIATLPLAPLYAALTGADPPVIRAAVAASLYLLAVAVGRAPDASSALGAAAILQLAWEPADLFTASFQLSFAACAGLVWISPALRELLPLPPCEPDASRARRALEWLVLSLVTTASATLATLPFTALHFERTSLAALPANLFAVPPGLAVTALAAAAVVAAGIHPALADPLLFAAVPLASVVDRLAGHFAGWPGARLPLPAQGAVDLLLLGSCVLAIVALTKTPRRALALLLLSVATLGLRALPVPHDGRLHVEFLPVGQGDATLITLPEGGRILVDTGGDPMGRYDVGTRLLLPQLRRRGVDRLEAVAISHLHPDHVGGMPAVLDTLEVGELWTSGRPLEGRWGAPIAEALLRRQVPTRLLAAGHPPLERGGVRVEILGPPDVDDLRDDPLLGDNDASLVLRLVHGDVAILLPGDVEIEGEFALADSGRPLEATLLKAPHHGSRTSSTPDLLERVKPSHVVFCVGHRNSYGFPHEEVEARYRQAGCSLHRTDRGPVHFVSDGRELTLAR